MEILILLTVDAHHHFWELGRFQYAWLLANELSPIRKTFLPVDLKPRIDAAGVDKTVFVQTQHNLDETKWVLDLADEHEFLAGVVGWVDLASTQCEEQLLHLKEFSKFVGVRHVTHDEPDENFIIRDDVLRGLKVLDKHRVPFDLLFFVQHLRHVPTLVKHCPELPMVIDHLAKPHIKDARIDNWLNDFKKAASFPNIFCKLSGMVTEADWKHWTPDQLKTYVDIALDCFGPQRCMFGSDWPVCELAGTYEQIYRALENCLQGTSVAERTAIFGGTATAFYGLAK